MLPEKDDWADHGRATQFNFGSSEGASDFPSLLDTVEFETSEPAPSFNPYRKISAPRSAKKPASVRNISKHNAASTAYGTTEHINIANGGIPAKNGVSLLGPDEQEHFKI